MEDIEIRIKPPGKVLTDFYLDDNQNVFIMGPLGSGKTFTSCQKILKKMVTQSPNEDGVRPSRWIAVRNTYPDLETTTINDWLELWGDLGKFTNGSPPTHDLNFDLDDGTTVIAQMVFLALDRPDSIKKLRGTQVTGFWLNETKELPKAVIDMADLRHGRYPTLAAGGVKCDWHGMIGDTNAPDEDHWYYTLAEETETPGWSFHKQPGGLLVSGDTYIDNPAAENVRNLPKDYYLRGMVGKATNWIKVNLCNNYGFVSDGKPIYPEYQDSIHCLDAHPDFPVGRGTTVYMGVDYGLTPAAVFAVRRSTGQWVFLSEVVTEDMGAVQFAELVNVHINEHYPNSKIAGFDDPAGSDRSQADSTQTPNKMMRAAGIPVTPTPTNDPVLRREAVAKSMTTLVMGGQPALVLSPRCKMLRKALAGGYRYRRLQVAGEERYTDVPDKGRYSHVADAQQYLMLGAGEGRALIKPARATGTLKATGTYSTRRRRING